MKKSIKNWMMLLVFSIIVVVPFTSCDKDTECKLEVKVENRDKKPVAFVAVSVNSPGASIYHNGYTNSDGIYSVTNAAPAIYTITVTDTLREWVYTEKVDAFGATVRDSNYEFVGFYTGSETVRLKDGETVKKTVVLDNYNLIH